MDDNVRAKVLDVFAVPLATSIGCNNAVKRHRLQAQALQAQPDNHFGRRRVVKELGGDVSCRVLGRPYLTRQ